MPEITPGFHKPLLKYFWARLLRNRETVETEFSIRTGRQIQWDPVPDGITRIMLIPFSPELAKKVNKTGECAIPTNGPRYEIDLDPDKIRRKIVPVSGMFWGCAHRYREEVIKGDKPIRYNITDVHTTDFYVCLKCHNKFQWNRDAYPVVECPECGTKNQWECRRCGSIELGEYNCPNCRGKFKRVGIHIDGKDLLCPKCGPDFTCYPTGLIIDEPLQFERGEMRCPLCEDEKHPTGLDKVIHLELHGITWLETRYVIGIEDDFEIEVGDEVNKGRKL